MIFLCDFETTGLLKTGQHYSNQPGITQMGGVILDHQSLEELDSFSMMVDPEIPDDCWEKKAIEITGIGPEQVKGADTFFSAFYKLTDFMIGCRAWSGYNTRFDIQILKHQLDRYGYSTRFPWPPYELDVIKIARDHFQMRGTKGLKFIKLGEAYKLLFNEEMEGAHDALGDCRATAAVLREIGADEVKRLYNA